MKSYITFLSILDAVIHDKSAIMPENDKFSELLGMAQAHNVLPLVVEKLCELPEFNALPEFGSYTEMVIGTVASQAQRTNAFLELYQAFSDIGIFPIVMKGIACRQLYGELSDHRPSGDEDILIRKNDFEAVKNVLVAQGFLAEREEITENQLEELQEISFYQSDSGLTVEVHTNPIGRENDIRIRMNDCFQDVFKQAKLIVVEGMSIWTMGDTDHFLFLILHAFKHMMVTGFGIRQVLDILLFYEKNENTIDLSYVLNMLETVKAKEFFSDLLYLGNQYLGFHFTPFDDCHCVDELLEDLMENGAFGNTTQAQQMARTMTNAAMEHGIRNGNSNLMRAVFPSRKYLMAGYPELVEKPWLLPVCWMKRWRKFWKSKGKNKRQLVKESFEISNRKISLLKKYGIFE